MFVLGSMNSRRNEAGPSRAEMSTIYYESVMCEASDLLICLSDFSAHSVALSLRLESFVTYA